MMFWSWQHLDCPHERSRNSQEDFVVWALLSPKWLSLLSLMQSVMRFGDGQVFQKVNDSALSVPRMVHWTSLRWCVSYVTYSPCILLFSIRLRVTVETNVEQVFSRTGQLSEVNLDPNSPTDMVSIMVNRITYKPSVKDIMDNHYEKNSVNNKDFFNSPDSDPDHSDQDSDTDGWTRLRTSWGLNVEEWTVCERETSLSFIKITQSVIY